MDFDVAIIAHTRWKENLRKSASGGTAIDVAALSRDDGCDLGKYLRTATPAEQALPEFATLRQRHTQFHKVAAETARAVPGKSAKDVESLIDSRSQFGLASAGCVTAIAALRDRQRRGH